MKNLFIMMFAMSVATFSSCAQASHGHQKKEKNSAVKYFESVNADTQQQLAKVLQSYYEIKDALVSDNENSAANGAKDLRKSLEAVDMKKMTTEQHTFYMPLQEKMDYDAEHIGSAPGIDHMREHFETLSGNMYSIVKAFHVSDRNAVYQQYCPMKKMYWLSKDEEIKNPYYGKEMLTCGRVTETLR
jgi:hypothetical protein